MDDDDQYKNELKALSKKFTTAKKNKEEADTQQLAAEAKLKAALMELRKISQYKDQLGLESKT